MKLIEDHDAGVLKERITRKLPAEHALGNEPQARRRPPALLEAHAVADLATNCAAALTGDELRRRTRGDTSRFEDKHLLAGS